MTRTPYESAATPTSHNAADPAELNLVCRTKPNLPNQTDTNAALLPYLTHQLGSAHEWSGVWNGPKVVQTTTLHEQPLVGLPSPERSHFMTNCLLTIIALVN